MSIPRRISRPTCTKFDANRCTRLTASQDFWMFDPYPPPPTCPPCASRGNLFGVYPFPDGSADVCQIWCPSRFTASPDFWICDPLLPSLPSTPLSSPPHPSPSLPPLPSLPSPSLPPLPSPPLPSPPNKFIVLSSLSKALVYNYRLDNKA